MPEPAEFEPLTVGEAAAYGVPYDEGIHEWPRTIHDIFRALEEHDELTRAELAEKTGWSTSTISERARQLIELGIATRRPKVLNPRETVYVFDPPGDGTRRDAARGESLRADGGRVRDDAPGTAIKFDGEAENDPNDWHHSVAFNGHEHSTACGIEVETREDVEEVLTGLPESWEEIDEDDRCPECHESIQALRSAAESGGEQRGE